MTNVEKRLEALHKIYPRSTWRVFDHGAEYEVHAGMKPEKLFIQKVSGDFSRPPTNERLAQFWVNTKVLQEAADTVPVNEMAADPGAHYRFQYTVKLTEENIAAKRVTVNLDPFRIAAIYGMTGFPEQTALKKLLCAGNRGYKDKRQDFLDIISALQRGLRMMEEDEANG